MSKLVILNQSLAGRTFELGGKVTTVGRAEDNTIQIADPSVSSRHAEIILCGAGVVIKDLNSTNGTFINDAKITEALLRPGDVLRFGQVELKLAGSRPPSAVPVPPLAPAPVSAAAAPGKKYLRMATLAGAMLMVLLVAGAITFRQLRRTTPKAAGASGPTAAVTPASSGLALTKPAPAKRPLPVPGAAEAIDHGDAAGLRNLVAQFLASKIAAGSPGQTALDGLCTDETPATALAMFEVLRSTGTTNLAAVLAAENGRDFLKAFLGDRRWMEMYLASGPAPEDTADGLQALREIWSADGGAADWPQFQKLATAIALVFGAPPSGRDLENLQAREIRPLTPLGRYVFFKSSHRRHQLHPLFDTLDTWTLRFVAWVRVENEALAWQQENVNLPLGRYTDACWMVQYRGASDFGDNIQGPCYYAPWTESQNWAENVLNHGGVCGSLSTFGCFSAVAHGIPAYTCGQPGHCAYAVRTAPGTWSGGFGGPDGGPHYYFWGGNYAYIVLMEAAFSNSAAMTLSQQRVWEAHLCREERPELARAAYQSALDASRLNYGAWLDYVDYLLADGSMKDRDWLDFGHQVLDSFGPHARPMCDLLERFEGKKLLPALPPEQRAAWFVDVQKAAARRQPSWSWDVGKDLLAKQVAALPKTGSDGFDLYRRALAIQAGDEQSLGQVLNWGVENFGATAEGSSRCVMALVDALQANGQTLKDEALHKIINTAITASEKAKSPAAFQAASELGRRFATVKGSLKLDKPPGRLISTDAVIMPSSYAWDDPCNHRGVLTETGGLFHTDKEKTPSVIVQLCQAAELSGVLLVNRLDGSGEREKKLRVSYSVDGATYFPLGQNDDFGQQWKIDLAGKSVRARYVKVESLNAAPEHFHLRNVLIFGGTPI